MYKALQNIIMYSYNKVPYYREIFDENKINPFSIKTCNDLSAIPILSKNIVQSNTSKFRSIDYLDNEKIILRRTSGSTGRLLNVFWSKEDYSRAMFYLWCVRNRVYGVLPKSKFCTFHSTQYKNNKLVETKDSFISYNGLNLSFSKLTLDDTHLFEYYKKMKEFQPSWLFLQPSIAFQLSKFMFENKLIAPVSIKYIELSGEYLSESHKKIIQSTFKVPVVNMYGCEEAYGIAIECPHGNLHCLSNNVIVESIKNNKVVGFGEEGEAHITSLNNRAMPFIRYGLGDRIILHPGGKCKCGNMNPIIEIKNGRLGNNIFLENKKYINSYLLLYPIEKINKLLNNPILQFKVIQHDFHNFTIFIIIDNHFIDKKELIEQLFREEVVNIGLINVNWHFVFPKRVLPAKLMGKLQFFYNEIQ